MQWKSSWAEKKKGRFLIIYGHGWKRLHLVKISLIYCQLKQIWVVRNTFLLSFLSLNFSPSLPTPLPFSPTKQHGRDGECVLQSVSPEEFLPAASSSSSHFSPTPVWSLHELQFLLKHLTASLHRLQRNLCSRVWSTSFPSSALNLGFPLLFLIPSSPPPHIFCLFLNIFSQRHHYLGWGTQVCPMEPPVSGTGQPWPPLPEPPLQPHRCQHLAMDTQYSLFLELLPKNECSYLWCYLLIT